MSLPGALEKVLKEIVEASNLRGASIRAILLSTTDGAPLGRVLATSCSSLADEVLLNLESAWSPPNKSLGMLTMGKVHQITASYNHGCVVHLYQTPIVRTSYVCCDSSTLESNDLGCAVAFFSSKR
jgi:hypothetical protein